VARLHAAILGGSPQGEALENKQPAIWFIEYAKSGFRLRIKKNLNFLKILLDEGSILHIFLSLSQGCENIGLVHGGIIYVITY
jgi:hypothetical protein